MQLAAPWVAPQGRRGGLVDSRMELQLRPRYEAAGPTKPLNGRRQHEPHAWSLYRGCRLVARRGAQAAGRSPTGYALASGRRRERRLRKESQEQRCLVGGGCGFGPLILAENLERHGGRGIGQRPATCAIKNTTAFVKVKPRGRLHACHLLVRKPIGPGVPRTGPGLLAPEARGRRSVQMVVKRLGQTGYAAQSPRVRSRPPQVTHLSTEDR